MHKKYFVLTNDPDHGLFKDYKNIFKSLSKNNIYITTAIFCTIKNDNNALCSHCNSNDTNSLSNDKYKDLMLLAKDFGHEIAFHGYSQSNDSRDEFKKGLDIYYDIFKEYPYTYIEHGGHMKSHNPEMVTNQNLSKFGKKIDSDYYVYDIVKEMFKLVWTHDYMDEDIHVKNIKDIFTNNDGVDYFSRSRMLNYDSKIKLINDCQNTFVGYTHFGYKGYKSRFNFIRNQLAKDSHYSEWWSTNQRDLNRIVEKIKNDILRYNLNSVTIKDLHQSL